MKAILIPIDNRPVTYVFPLMIAQIAGIHAVAPPRELMGSLQAQTNVDAVSDWLLEAISEHKPDGLLVCMDTIIYGGLIPSRRIEATAAQMIERTKLIRRWKRAQPKMSMYAQSSIMRISDNYDNTEEKSYWSRFGREIYAWSESMHRMAGTTGSVADRGKMRPGELDQIESRIPLEIRQDYLDTRQRNFQVNRKILDYAESGDIDFLVFSQDDSGEFGLNVLEKQRLLAEAQRRRLKNVLSYAGADEVLMTMLGRWLISKSERSPRARVSFSPTEGARIASRYEGQSIGESVASQLSAIGIVSEAPSSPSSDLHVIIHTSGDRQGDHIWLTGHPDMRSMNTSVAVTRTIELLEQSTDPCIICDVAYSNGSDPALVDELLKRPDLLAKLYGYAGWNTTGNTLGCALAMGVAQWYANQGKPQSATSAERFRSALFVRFADDWAFQTQARKHLGQELSLQTLNDAMTPLLQRIATSLQLQARDVVLSLPWQRSFEVEIKIPAALQRI